MNCFMYQAKLYCQQCGLAIRAKLLTEGNAPTNPDDESTYCSRDYPKGPFPEGVGEADCPQHCESGPDCINAISINGTKVGIFLENELTFDGVQYVKNALRDNLYRSSVALFWKDAYEDMGYDFS